TPEELVRATRDAAGQGLLVLPLAHDGATTRAALTRPDLVGTWLSAWARQDHDAIGNLLGFPRCCRIHFAETWARGITDTVLSMDLPSSDSGPHAGGPAEAN